MVELNLRKSNIVIYDITKTKTNLLLKSHY